MPKPRTMSPLMRATINMMRKEAGKGLNERGALCAGLVVQAGQHTLAVTELTLSALERRGLVVTGRTVSGGMWAELVEGVE